MCTDELSSLIVNSMLALDALAGPSVPGTLGSHRKDAERRAFFLQATFRPLVGPGARRLDTSTSRVSRAFAQSFVLGLGVVSTLRYGAAVDSDVGKPSSTTSPSSALTTRRRKVKYRLVPVEGAAHDGRPSISPVTRNEEIE